MREFLLKYFSGVNSLHTKRKQKKDVNEVMALFSSFVLI